MENNANIYDCDGELIRAAGDNHRFTIDEAKEKIQYYQQKIKEISGLENPTKEDIKKLRIYENYCRNLFDYQFKEMSKMRKEDLLKLFTTETKETTEEQVNKALNELNNDLTAGNSTEDEIHGSTPNNTESTTNEEPGDDKTVERPECNIHEKRTITQDDLLVERDAEETVMDEYVSPIGEASDEYVHFEEMPVSNETSKPIFEEE